MHMEFMKKEVQPRQFAMVESEKKTANRGNDNRVLHPSNCGMVDFARENGL